jgi:hypothetical protein
LTYSVDQLLDPERCEELLRATNELIDTAYTRENAVARRSYVFEYMEVAQAFAFSVHCPGSPATDHLPGFRLEELPPALASVFPEICKRLGVQNGRVMFNVGRYPERCGAMNPHYDGELFDYEVVPDEGNVVRNAIRPHRVALLTLRNDSIAGGTRLHDPSDRIVTTNTRAGDLLVFDNLFYRHSVPDPVYADDAERGPGPPRWIRYTVGWRALEDDCFHWQVDRPLRALSLEEAIALHERFLATKWPEQIEGDLARASFPYPTAWA